jgi:hypothetical protein
LARPRSSPSAETALKGLERLEAIVKEALADDMLRYKSALVKYEAQVNAAKAKYKDALKVRKKGDPVKLGAELKDLLAKEPKKPVMRRYITNDTSIEKLGEILQDNPC